MTYKVCVYDVTLAKIKIILSAPYSNQEHAISIESNAHNNRFIYKTCDLMGSNAYKKSYQNF